MISSVEWLQGDGLFLHRQSIDFEQPVNGLAPVTVTRTSYRVVGLPSTAMQGQGSLLEDRHGRKPSVRLLTQSNRRDGGWALPVEVVPGYNGGSSTLEILGWYHAPN